MADERVGLGYIGCANWARALAVGVVRSEVVRIVSGFSRRTEPRERFAADFECEPCESIEQMLADDRVRGVVVCTPNDVHAENCIAAARAGKHVFVDKPITARVDAALKVVEACREAGVILSVGHNTRRRGAYRKMKELLEAGAVGTACMAEAHSSHNGGLRLTAEKWRADAERCPALPLTQLGVHHIDTLRYLLGRIESVSSMMARRVIELDNVDTTVQTLRFAGGPVGYLGSNYVSPGTGFVRVYGEKAVIEAERPGEGVRIRYPDRRREILPVAEVNSNVEEIEEFGRAIRGECRVEVDGETGTENLAVVLAALRSHRERREVTVEEILEAGRRGEC
jgi:predicted dehydrogenase